MHSCTQLNVLHYPSFFFFFSPVIGRVMGGSEFMWIGMAILLLQLIPGILGWGKDGHYTVCKIAQGYLSEDASLAVNELLPRSAQGDLASVCSWADEIRFHYHWSGPLHYIDTPDFRCNYNYSRDCHNSAGQKNMCVSGAINNYTMQLMSGYKDSNTESKYNLTEALMFLSHFIGDIHQPLHVGFTGDEGGNTITVRWYRRKTNLHHVWDNMIIESAVKMFYGSDLSMMIQAIQRNITDGWSDDILPWESCSLDQTACPDSYAFESINLACKFAYRNATPGSTLEDDYFLSRLPVVEKRLAQGGVRLAATLNRIFASQPSISQE
ncbi:endonuclease 4-like isoform X2 [Rhododendron vialii]|uniref:endonuclease 4-like isoform X2 n=2 Tax=Rhododendron vialii TaxID=182163 RepID=UPI00265EF039|nr:endonuclease 4-like isoform X2 [Rhododendron vialii]